MDAAETVLDAVRELEAHGYTGDLVVDAAGVRCGACGAQHEPEHLVVTHTYRFEGASDPDDEAIVFGVACPVCEARGIIVSAYGPGADPALFEVISRIR
jgi:hypothetical protein